MKTRKGIPYKVTFRVASTSPGLLMREVKPKVAVIRQEGSNGDREMLAGKVNSPSTPSIFTE